MNDSEDTKTCHRVEDDLLSLVGRPCVADAVCVHKRSCRPHAALDAVSFVLDYHSQASQTLRAIHGSERRISSPGDTLMST